MPELPEVETVARQLSPLVAGQTVRGLEILDRKLTLSREEVDRIVGRRIRTVQRLGKQVVLELAPPGRQAGCSAWLAVHLRMTGRLRWYAAQSEPETERHLRARFALDRGRLLFFDARRFGTLRLHDSREQAEPAGLDPMSAAFTLPRLAELCDGGEGELKPWLLRQDRLVGLGNIYASEILHQAGLNPRRRPASLAPAELGRLHRAIRQVLRRAIEHCGTTFDTFEDARGASGGFQRFLAVYGREGEPCRSCGHPVARLVQQGRSTFYCPVCQETG